MVGCSEIETINSGADLQHVADFPDSYDPIPLTIEILEKSGWGEKMNPLMTDFKNQQGLYFCNIPDGIQVVNAIFKTDILFLHQLQNLYFALTGEELVIKL